MSYKVSGSTLGDNRHDAATGAVDDPCSNDDDYVNQANLGAHRKGITHDEMVAYYSNWAQQYDQELRPRYNGPAIAADFVKKHMHSQNGQLEILDGAAGTGFLGEQLKESGFNCIDALEPSPGMLDVARKKKIYRQAICDYIGAKETNISADKYDCLAIAGGFGEGHIPCVGLREMIRVVKPGGIICFVMRQQYQDIVAEYRGRLEPFMDKLEQAGCWTRLEKTVVPFYSFSNDGVVYVYRINQAGPVDKDIQPQGNV